jgi:hypothetical protein|eukprot:COSAG02_NODE_5336_length_4426_cov_2.244973_4_plen_69_part_00
MHPAPARRPRRRCSPVDSAQSSCCTGVVLWVVGGVGRTAYGSERVSTTSLSPESLGFHQRLAAPVCSL